MQNNLIVQTPEELKYIMCKPPSGSRHRHIYSKNGKCIKDWIHNCTDKINTRFMYHPVKDLKLHSHWRNSRIKKKKICD